MGVDDAAWRSTVDDPDTISSAFALWAKFLLPGMDGSVTVRVRRLRIRNHQSHEPHTKNLPADQTIRDATLNTRPGEPAGMLPLAASDLLSGPALFVALLSVAFLVIPLLYLLKALQERGTFDRVLNRR